MQVSTRYENRMHKTEVSFFGLRADAFLYMQAGLRMEGINSNVYDCGEYPQNTDRYMRHITYETPEPISAGRLELNGRLLFEYLEMSERHEEIVAEGVAAVIPLPQPESVPVAETSHQPQYMPIAGGY